jgi:hypothetical protein
VREQSPHACQAAAGELGISLPGLARNRWRIGEVERAAAPRAVAGQSARERFTVVPGGRDG